MRNRWGSDRTGILPALAASIAAAALVLPMASASAQGASTGIDGTAWLVEDIAGRGVIDRAQTTISFDAPGRVSGSTGCNRYTGVATLEGEALRFGQLATTRRACVPALMDQEQKFIRAMQDVRSYVVAYKRTASPARRERRAPAAPRAHAEGCARQVRPDHPGRGRIDASHRDGQLPRTDRPRAGLIGDRDARGHEQGGRKRDGARGGQDHDRAQPGAHCLRDRSRARPYRSQAYLCGPGPHPRPARRPALDLDPGLPGHDRRTPQFGRRAGRSHPQPGRRARAQPRRPRKSWSSFATGASSTCG